MTRTDVHRPSVINPADYEFVAFEYLKTDDFGAAAFMISERALIRAHMNRTGGNYSGHEHGGTCHVCGSVNAIYTALFYHAPSNTYVRTGLDCTEKLDQAVNGDVFRRKVGRALEARKGKNKAKAILEAKGLADAWTVYESYDNCETSPAPGKEEVTITDIVGKLIKYGNASDAQLKYVGTLLDRIKRRPEIEVARKAEQDAAAPVPVTAARVEIVGKVLSIREPDAYAPFPSWKMLVQVDAGWKVWSSIPSALRGRVARGDRISFVAGLKVSDKDSKFGFANRPAQAKVIT